MKKSLICLSVLGLSLAAHAQSSVTLQGTVDETLERGTGSVADRTQLTSGGNATSKIIIRGIEDLGGGMHALFHLETGFAADDGTFQSTNTNNQPSGSAAAPTGTQGMTFNRRSIVGLQGAWGEVHLGREWSPMYDVYTTRYDPFGVGVGISSSYAGGIVQSLGAVRMSNDIAYISPNFGGLNVNIQHWLGEKQSGTAGSSDGTGSGIRFDYDKGPISARVHWGRTDYATGNAEFKAVAAAYDFGVAKVSGNYTSDRLGALSMKGALIGVVVPVGASEFKASYSGNRSDAVGHPEAKKLAVGYVYNFSKRTALYTTFARLTNSGGSKQALGGATTAPNASSNGLDIGIRHNF